MESQQSSNGRFDLQQHDDGQIYVTEAGEQMLHAQINGPHDVEIQIGGHQPEFGTPSVVTIDKLYGPLVFWPIRVKPIIETCEWVIEREFGPKGEWREVARIPGQIEEDFSND